MPLIQLAEVYKEENRAAWGDLAVVAIAVIEYMLVHARGVTHAKTLEQVVAGSVSWAAERDFSSGFDSAEVPCVLHKLSQGVAHAALRWQGCPIRFYVHHDYRQRLLEESRDVEGVFAEVESKHPPKPCVTCCCPYAGTWEPPLEGEAKKE